MAGNDSSLVSIIPSAGCTSNGCITLVNTPTETSFETDTSFVSIASISSSSNEVHFHMTLDNGLHQELRSQCLMSEEIQNEIQKSPQPNGVNGN